MGAAQVFLLTTSKLKLLGDSGKMNSGTEVKIEIGKVIKELDQTKLANYMPDTNLTKLILDSLHETTAIYLQRLMRKSAMKIKLTPSNGFLS